MANIDELTRAVVEGLREPHCLVDGEGTVLLANRPAQVLLPCPEPDRPAVLPLHFGLRPWNHAAAEEESGELRIAHGGGERLLRWHATPLSAGGRGWRLVHLEDGDQPVDQPMQCDIQSTLRAIIDTITDGVIVITETGTIQLFNPAAERLFRYRRDEAIGHNVNLLVPSPHREQHDGYLANYRRTGVAKIIGSGREVFGRRKDGSQFPMYLSIGELRDGGRRLFVGIIHDLTQRKDAEAKLQVLSQAVEQNPAAVLIADRDGRIEYVNQGFSRLTGLAAGLVIGQTPRLLGSGQNPPDQFRRLWSRLDSGESWQGEVCDRRKNGETYWALETITPIRDKDGTITRYIAMQQDVTQQKRDREALQESEERFRHVAEMVGEWLWEQDDQGRYTYSSGAVRAILGYDPDEIIGRSYLDFLTADDRARWQRETSEGGRRQMPFYRLINRCRHRDGHEVFTESTGAPVFGDDGRLLRWRGMDLDITVRKRFEDALRVRERAIEAANVGISIAESRGGHWTNIYVNPALSRITGYGREELMEHSFSMLQGPETSPVELQKVRAALVHGVECEVTVKNYRKDGTAFWNELLLSPVRDDAGHVTHYIGVQTDVSERRRAEEERHELEIAKHIQLSLLPKGPLDREGADVAGICIPATHVGGDYFDYFRFGEHIDMVIADVSGHSVGAALIMAEMRSTLKAETRKTRARGMVSGPAEMLRALNELLYEDLCSAELFITMFYARYEPRARRLRYANAGHNPALVYRAVKHSWEALDADGLILGVRREVVFEEKSLNLDAEDRLLLYTDGFTEASNERGEFFGMQRLADVFVEHSEQMPEPLIRSLADELRRFRGGAELSDDLSMVVLRCG